MDLDVGYTIGMGSSRLTVVLPAPRLSGGQTESQETSRFCEEVWEELAFEPLAISQHTDKPHLQACEYRHGDVLLLFLHSTHSVGMNPLFSPGIGRGASRGNRLAGERPARQEPA